MIQTVADSDIRYDPEREDKDWRHRMALRQQAVVAAADDELQTHLNVLRLDSVGPYQDWCLQHGFAPLLGKSRRQLKREQDFVRLLVKQEQYVYDPSQESTSAIRRVYAGHTCSRIGLYTLVLGRIFARQIFRCI